MTEESSQLKGIHLHPGTLTKLGTDFDGPSWIQYDLFRKNKLPGSKKVNLAKSILPALHLGTLTKLTTGVIKWPSIQNNVDIRRPHNKYLIGVIMQIRGHRITIEYLCSTQRIIGQWTCIDFHSVFVKFSFKCGEFNVDGMRRRYFNEVDAKLAVFVEPRIIGGWDDPAGCVDILLTECSCILM